MKANKVVTLGDSRTGKTSVLSRFMSNIFDPTHTSSVGIDWFSKSVTFNQNDKQCEVRLFLWDTSGQERFKSLTPAYVKDARVVLLVFDLAEPESLKNVQDWWRQADKQGTNCIYILVGNKCDLERQCETADIDEVKRVTGAEEYYEVSAKEGTGIEKLFQGVGSAIYKQNQQDIEKVPMIDLSEPANAGSETKWFCC